MKSMRRVALALALIALTAPASAGEIPSLDLAAIDQEMLAAFFGPWEVRNADGSRTCIVNLTREPAIGGLAIEVSEDCARVFPVMDEVAAWRLLEGWVIVFADATRKELIRFTTPDETYVADPETDGIATIRPAD